MTIVRAVSRAGAYWFALVLGFFASALVGDPTWRELGIQRSRGAAVAETNREMMSGI